MPHTGNGRQEESHNDGKGVLRYPQESPAPVHAAILQKQSCSCDGGVRGLSVILWSRILKEDERADAWQ